MQQHRGVLAAVLLVLAVWAFLCPPAAGARRGAAAEQTAAVLKLLVDFAQQNSGAAAQHRAIVNQKYVGFPTVFSIWERQLQTQLAPLFEGVREPMMRAVLLFPITDPASKMAEVVWTSWVSVHMCCQTVLADDSFDVDVKQACRRGLATIKPHAELAAAHVGYTSYCSRDGVVMLGDFARYVRNAISMFKSAHEIDKAFAGMFGGGGWSRREAVTLLAQFAFDPSTPGNYSAHYLELVSRLNGTGMLHSWSTATGTIAFSDRVLSMMLQSLAADGLVHFHKAVTGPWDMTKCRNISAWFDSSQLFSELGRECGERTRAAADAWLWDIAVQESQSRADAAHAQQPATDTRARRSDVVENAVEDVVEVRELCHGWLGCAAMLLVWVLRSSLVAVCGFLLLKIMLRPDLLVVWKSMHDEVHTPGFGDYSRQVKLLRAMARRTQQAVGSAGGGTTTTSSSSARRPDNSPFGSPESHHSTAWMIRRSVGSSYRRRASATPAGTISRPRNAGSSSSSSISRSNTCPESSQSHNDSIFASYCRHVVAACWWPRVRFVVSAYSQALVGGIGVSVQLLIALLFLWGVQWYVCR